jgi:hypothetical protein
VQAALAGVEALSMLWRLVKTTLDEITKARIRALNAIPSFVEIFRS